MPNSLKITIDSETVLITTEDGSQLSRRSNLLAVDPSGQIINLGRPIEELQKIPNTRVLNPFASAAFQAELAGKAINKMAHSATLLLTESNGDDSKKPVIMSWNIQFRDYEKLTPEVQESFEYYVQLLPQGFKLKALTINNQPKNIEVFQRATQAFMIGLYLTVIAFQLFVFKILQFTMPEQMAKPLTGFQILLYILASGFFVYIVGILYIAACRLLLKKVIPPPVYKKLILDSGLSPEKLAGWLRDKLSFPQSGG